MKTSLRFALLFLNKRMLLVETKVNENMFNLDARYIHPVLINEKLPANARR